MKTKQHEVKRRRTQALMLMVLLDILVFNAGMIDAKISIQVEPEETMPVVVTNPVAGVSADIAKVMDKKSRLTGGVSNAFVGQTISLEKNDTNLVTSSYEEPENINEGIRDRVQAEIKATNIRLEQIKLKAREEAQIKAEELLTDEYYTLEVQEFTEICETEVEQIGKNLENVYNNMPEEFCSICEEAYAEAKKVVGESFYYLMTEEEFEMECKLAVAEAGDQGLMGMVYVINCSINNALKNGIDLIQDINIKNRYSPVKGGKIYLGGVKEVTEEMITDEVKQAVTMASKKDYTEELLRDVTFEKGLNDPKYYECGALYFYDPNGLSPKAEKERANISVSFKHRGHVFYRFWD